jgi:hypothetical protein
MSSLAASYNYPLWSAQVLPAIRAVQVEDLTGIDLLPEKDISAIVDGKAVKQHNPAYSAWVARDQVDLGYLLFLGSSVAHAHRSVFVVDLCLLFQHTDCTRNNFLSWIYYTKMC